MVVITVWPNLFPFRTEKLNALVPMVRPRRLILRGLFLSSADLPPLHCPGLGSKGRLSTRPPALPVGKGAGRCAPMWPQVGVASGLFVSVRQRPVVLSFLPAVCRWAVGLRAGPCGGSRLSVPVRPVSVTHYGQFGTI